MWEQIMIANDNNNDDREDELFGALFAPMNREAPPPDEEFRRRLGRQSLAAFEAQFAKGGPAGDGAGHQGQPFNKRPTRRARMISIAWRSGAAAAAAA